MMSCAPFHSIPLDVLIDIRFYLNLDVKEREVKIYHLQIRAETMPRLFTTLALFMKLRETSMKRAIEYQVRELVSTCIHVYLVLAMVMVSQSNFFGMSNFALVYIDAAESPCIH